MGLLLKKVYPITIALDFLCWKFKLCFQKQGIFGFAYMHIYVWKHGFKKT